MQEKPTWASDGEIINGKILIGRLEDNIVRLNVHCFVDEVIE